jgi:hypothetical protein
MPLNSPMQPPGYYADYRDAEYGRMIASADRQSMRRRRAGQRLLVGLPQQP